MADVLLLRSTASVAAVAALAALSVLAALAGLAGCGRHTSDAPTAPGPARSAPVDGGLQRLARDVRANARQSADPCRSVTAQQLALLGLHAPPTRRSVDFVARRCRWSSGADSLEVAVSATGGHAHLAPDGRPVRVPSAVRAVAVHRPLTRDHDHARQEGASGLATFAIVAERPGRSVVVELTARRTVGVARRVLPAIAEAALRST